MRAVTFNLGVGVILVIICVFDSFRGQPGRRWDFEPMPRVIALLTDSGFVLRQQIDLNFGEALLAFDTPGCEAPTTVLYMPMSRSESAEGRAFQEAHAARLHVIHAGRSFKSVGWIVLRARVLWEKTMIALGVRSLGPWGSVVLNVLFPQHCPGPAVDWSKLT